MKSSIFSFPLKNQVSFSRSDGLPKYRNPKDSFGRSGGLPKIRYSEERENSKIRSGGLPCSEEQENSKDSIWWASEERKTKKPRFIRSGGLPKNENPKICLGGLLKNENPKIKIRKCGRLPINKNSKIKIRFGFGWIGFDFGLWAFDSIGCDILGLWICIGCDISLAGFGSIF
ncbi:unnamed protein product [Rhizophagus irregularis]|nr:unnamed protein product [Rhizophagus irregularis]